LYGLAEKLLAKEKRRCPGYTGDVLVYCLTEFTNPDVLTFGVIEQTCLG
jgi:hypothetical protein